MALPAQCPKCGEKRTRRASTALRHWARVLIGSRKRYCPACGEKWHVAAAVPNPPLTALLTREEKFFLACVIAGPLLLAVLTHPHFLRDWVKGSVRHYYDERYGPDSEARLWRDFGRLMLDHRPESAPGPKKKR